MRRAVAAALVALVALAATACSRLDETAGGGLVAQELDLKADDAIKGPRGVYVTWDTHGQLLDPSTERLAGDPVFAHGDGVWRLAIDDEGAFWFTDGLLHTVGRATTDDIVEATLAMPEGEAAGIALSGGHVWVSSIDPPVLVPFSNDGSHGEPVETPCELFSLVGTAGAVWGACDKGVVRMDSETRRFALIDTGGEPLSLAATDSRMWALVGGRLIAIHLDSGEVADPVDAPVGANNLAGAGDNLWVASASEQTRQPDQITRYKDDDFTLVGGPVEVPGSTDDVGAKVSSMAALGDDLWVAVTFYGGQLIVVRPQE